MRTVDRGVFEQVFRSAYPSVLRTAYLVLHDRGRAEEVTQDAFLRLYERWSQAVGYDHPVAWVRKVTIRAAIRRADVGFWRPFQAIAQGDADGNPDTAGQTGWTPLVPNPSYSDYTSGHAAATAPFAEVVRQTLGDDVPLLLRSGGRERSYATLTALQHDAFHARIWGGLHFRDAMEDGYYLGHTVANLVMHEIR